MGRLIFDIGCADGEWIKANYNEEDKFVGVEAKEETYLMAVNRFKDKSNVILLNRLIADKTGYLDFFLSEVPNGSTASLKMIYHSRNSTVTNWYKFIRVKAIMLDSLIEEYGVPDYIKIDVEGYEKEVLAGLTQKVGMVSFEFMDEFKEETLWCLNHLKELGYKEFSWAGGTDEYTYIPEEWYDYDSFFEILSNELQPERRQAWGMLYVK